MGWAMGSIGLFNLFWSIFGEQTLPFCPKKCLLGEWLGSAVLAPDAGMSRRRAWRGDKDGTVLAPSR